MQWYLGSLESLQRLLLMLAEEVLTINLPYPFISLARDSEREVTLPQGSEVKGPTIGHPRSCRQAILHTAPEEGLPGCVLYSARQAG